MKPEEVFQTVTKVLDALVEQCKPQLSAENFKISDMSAREYHYKNPYLSWSLRFQKDSIDFGVVSRVTTFLTYMEPTVDSLNDPPMLDSLIKVEKFRQYQESEIEKKIESRILLSAIESTGLLRVIKGADCEGRKLII